MDYLILLIISIVVVAIALIGLAFNIIFKKSGKFPETEVGHNKDMRGRGITCIRCEELKNCSYAADMKETASGKEKV